MIKISKRDLKAALREGDSADLSDADLARWFGISQSAVSQWSDDAPIPEFRALQVAVKRPDLFGHAPANDEAAA